MNSYELVCVSLYESKTAEEHGVNYTGTNSWVHRVTCRGVTKVSIDSSHTTDR